MLCHLFFFYYLEQSVPKHNYNHCPSALQNIVAELYSKGDYLYFFPFNAKINNQSADIDTGSLLVLDHNIIGLPGALTLKKNVPPLQRAHCGIHTQT